MACDECVYWKRDPDVVEVRTEEVRETVGTTVREGTIKVTTVHEATEGTCDNTDSRFRGQKTASAFTCEKFKSIAQAQAEQRAADLEAEGRDKAPGGLQEGQS